MKKLNKKLLAIGLTVLFFSFSLIFLVGAQEGEQPFFRVNSASTTPANTKRAGDEAIIYVVNRSGQDYFVPNKTRGEFDSFKENAPNYVSVSVCGDEICGEGETLENCRDDCKSPQTKYVDYCGDGFCNQLVVCTTTPQVITVDPSTKWKICNKTSFWGWVYSGAVQSAIYNTLYLLGIIEKNDFCATSRYTINVETCTEAGPESWESCPDDCVPSSSSGCGICGYDGAGNLCPNWCDGARMTLTNCEVSNNNLLPMLSYAGDNPENLKSKSLAKYFKISSALAWVSPLENTVDYRIGASWRCKNTAAAYCPAGKYCYPSGLETSPNITCPAGKFCPSGSFYPRACPPGTYSEAGSATCTKCPGGFSKPLSTSVQDCYPVYIPSAAMEFAARGKFGKLSVGLFYFLCKVIIL